LDAYVTRITGDVKLARKMHIAVDCGNGVAGMLAPRLYRALGCEVTELFCEVDGRFPNHHPDPSVPKNLQDLIATLKKTGELGFAFDGDGDRLGLVTQDGEIVFADRQLMLFAKDVLSRNPGAEIIYDVKSTRLLEPWIARHGGRATIWKTGHSLIKAKLRETGALLAGEMSGHTFFKERWYGFDDALYAGARLLEILSREKDPQQTLKSLPNAALASRGRRAARAGGEAPGRQAFSRRGTRADDRWRARRVRRRLRPRARIQHHAGGRATLRSGFECRPGTDQEGFSRGAPAAQARCASSLLAASSSRVTPWLPAPVCSTAA
jgi:hypothetical protein